MLTEQDERTVAVVKRRFHLEETDNSSGEEDISQYLARKKPHRPFSYLWMDYMCRAFNGHKNSTHTNKRAPVSRPFRLRRPLRLVSFYLQITLHLLELILIHDRIGTITVKTFGFIDSRDSAATRRETAGR